MLLALLMLPTCRRDAEGVLSYTLGPMQVNVYLSMLLLNPRALMLYLCNCYC